MSPDRCSARSEAAGETLAGTASIIRRWLLLEHPGPWGRDGLLDARLPAGLGRRLRDVERRTGARVLLIRRPGGGSGPGVSCFVVDTETAAMGARRLSSIEDAAGLDPDRDGLEPSTDRVVVVCTHGRRDPCCAERGRPLARATAEAYGDLTWESTHVGGDRFAANLVAFPHGLYFGGVLPEHGPQLVGEYTRGRILLDRYRGRSSHPRHVQTAEVALRVELGADGLDDVRLETHRREGDRAVARFAAPGGSYVVRLGLEHRAPMRLTCHATQAEAAPVWRPIALTQAGDGDG